MMNNNLEVLKHGSTNPKAKKSDTTKVKCFSSAYNKKRESLAKEKVYKAANNLNW
ncbi:hypothetical protein CWC29_014550 [Pseudoalteromonas sp. S4498]|uniref:Uncharacterized protein n=1 Tax=Pseudoalteromonas galatheae TaxID=579562 RepID=A0A8T6YSY7_9GAMM|nr:hypothetical protein [Pseudoalteromonas galatheae]NKC20032.1 hypothetical protein [Pseudoalteromonas galatheae]